MAKRYVQHISGQGKKWELTNDGRQCNDQLDHPAWATLEDCEKPTFVLFLPKSEYRLCDPPDNWVDVTRECGLIAPNTQAIVRANKAIVMGNICPDYRFRRVHVWKNVAGIPCEPFEAFIVEQNQV